MKANLRSETMKRKQIKKKNTHIEIVTELKMQTVTVDYMFLVNSS